MRRLTYVCDRCGAAWWRVLAPYQMPSVPPGWTLTPKGEDVCAACIAERVSSIEELLRDSGLTNEIEEGE